LAFSSPEKTKKKLRKQKNGNFKNIGSGDEHE
jgi:hypothetical protein